MIQAIGIASRPRTRGLLAQTLFPSIRARFAVALLLTFFPYCLLYPLDYPAGELLTLCCWIWVFPSPVGWLSLGLLPLMPTGAYGYFAFNLFCLTAPLSIAVSAFRSRELQFKDLTSLCKLARWCMIVTLAIAAVQAVTDQSIWMSVFTNMRLEPGRGAGFKYEPSQLGSLLALYLALLVGKIEGVRAARAPVQVERPLFREAIWVILATLALTRSLTVLIVALCFVPILFIRQKHILPSMAGLLAGVLVGVSFLGDRIGEAIDTSGGSLTELITGSVSSWRNIPDILILSNLRDFLLPGNPAEVRIKITICAIRMSPALVWIQNTFSNFSAGGVAVGVLVTGSVFIVGMAIGLRSFKSFPMMRTSWLMLYLAAWFFMSKWDPSAWIALGLLLLVHRLNGPETEQYATAVDRESKPEYLGIRRKPANSGLPAQSATASCLHAGACTEITSGFRSNRTRFSSL